MRPHVLALLVFLVVPPFLVAQKTEADVRARLVNQPLYLRWLWSGDELAFDHTGKLEGTSAEVSFTLAGVDIQSVKLTKKELVLEGQRVGLEFNHDVPTRVGLVVRETPGSTKPEKMTIRIERPADGDFTAALDLIFADSIAELAPGFPPYWRRFAEQHLLPAGTVAAPVSAAAAGSPAQPSETAKMRRIGGGVTPPRLLTKVDPQFSSAAAAQKYSGVVQVNFVVDASGMPSRFRILHPVGLGLDEQAVAAVSQYTFQPATESGLPVTVELNVEVNFQIF